ncbi:MAG: ABC transporter substrate-binding protein [Pseudomonadota bacterium]
MLLIGLGWKNLAFTKDKIHIAVVIPESQKEGTSGRRGIQMYLDMINRRGGVNGRELVADFKNDENNPDIAEKKAVEIVEENRAVAVIGHYSSASSLRAKDIYIDAQIPAISPSSTNDRLTIDNDYYFRTIFTNSYQGRFLAYYIKNVLKLDSVCILREDKVTSSGIAETFEQVAKEIGLKITFKKIFNIRDEKLDQKLHDIVQELRVASRLDAIFLGTHANEGAKIVKLLRESGINTPLVGPTAFATQAFSKSFISLQKEKDKPGFYTNRIYVAVPLIIDTANELAQQFRRTYRERYDEEPDWYAAYSYDTIKILVEAIEKSAITGEPATIKEDRVTLRNNLISFNAIDTSIEGVTGPNFYNQNGDSLKRVYIGVYRNNQIISSQTQLQRVRNINLIPDRREALEKGRILSYKDHYAYKTNVVYSGIAVNDISKFDHINASFLIDFYIWFRYQGNFEAQNIIFLNAMDPINLHSPEMVSSDSAGAKLKNADQPLATFIREDRKDGLISRLYRVHARFKANFNKASSIIDGTHLLGFKFRHRELNKNNLIYVTDVLGMSLNEKYSYQEKLENDAMMALSNRWNLESVEFYQNITQKSSMGDLRYLDIPNKIDDYSQFNFSMILKEKTFSIRRKIPSDVGIVISALSIMSLILLYIIRRAPHFTIKSKSTWFLWSLSAFTLLLSSEAALIPLMEPLLPSYVKPTIVIFDMLWWIVPLSFLHMGLQPFLWEPIERKTHQPTPAVLRHFSATIIYFTAGYGIIVFVFGINIANIMATSGAVAMGIGFLVKDNIFNFFACISIINDYNIKIGQWIQISGYEEGRVEEITKQTTCIRTRDGGLLNIPNSVVLSSTIKNYGHQKDLYTIEIKVETVPNVSTDFVMDVIEKAVRSTDCVLNDPEPNVMFDGPGDSSVIFIASFSVTDYDKKEEYKTAAWKSIWAHFDKAGIEFSTPHRVIHMVEDYKEDLLEEALNASGFESSPAHVSGQKVRGF